VDGRIGVAEVWGGGDVAVCLLYGVKIKNLRFMWMIIINVRNRERI